MGASVPAPIQQARTRLAPRVDLRAFSSSSKAPAVYVQFGGQKGKPPPRKKLSRDYYIAGAILGLGGIYYVAHLEKVPETGRWRFMNVSANTERWLGEQMLKRIINEHRNNILPGVHPYSREVTDVVRRLVHSSGLGYLRGEQPPAQGSGGTMAQGMWNDDDRLRVDVGTPSDRASVEAQLKEWTVFVVASDEVNAFTTFGGNIVVFTGILPVCRDADGLAAVLGHEIAHCVARHPSEAVSMGSVITFLAYVVDLVGLVPLSLGSMAMNFLLSLPNSRTQEYEADRIGQKLMARACFDPRAAPAFFARLAEVERQKSSGGKGLELLRTHPLTDKRIQKLEAFLPEAYQAQAESGRCGDTAQHFDDFSRALGGRRSGGVPSRGAGGWGESEFVKEDGGSGSVEVVWR
ncbi:hypothetical protein AURDEDRAFT_115184 [Auricularia subglabra TFB-10046 SS5]|nr:hypothetical protein AURDEDRAFT_115184 [Auricularia subglabra TFB-10046 SS5]